MITKKESDVSIPTLHHIRKRHRHDEQQKEHKNIQDANDNHVEAECIQVVTHKFAHSHLEKEIAFNGKRGK